MRLVPLAAGPGLASTDLALASTDASTDASRHVVLGHPSWEIELVCPQNNGRSTPLGRYGTGALSRELACGSLARVVLAVALSVASAVARAPRRGVALQFELA